MKEQAQLAEISVSYRPAISNKPIIASSFDAYIALLEFFPEETIALQEQVVVLYLNRSNRVIGGYKLSSGGISTAIVDVRMVLSVALKTAAVGFILAHNHPSGNLSPSTSDKELTYRLKEAAKLLELQLKDHIILSPERNYYSFADEGLA